MTEAPRAKLAYLSNPSPGVFILNTQLPGQEGVTRVEISLGHLRGFIVEGASMAFRSSANDTLNNWLVSRENRVPENQTESANDRTAGA